MISGPDDLRRTKVEHILQAGIGARGLVRQLLAFSRKQNLEYRLVNTNSIVKGFEKLIRRTIPENIEIRLELSPDIDAVMADVGQIEQVLMNLSVNAADAMSEGGTLVISTRTVTLVDDSPEIKRQMKAGDYVMLSVADSGCGMSEEVQKQLFEPFFTTKGDEGTGLGLSTVYGIVQQHGGSIIFGKQGKQGYRISYIPSRY